MTNKSYDNEVADDLISKGAERVRQEALRQLINFDIEDDDARIEPLLEDVSEPAKKRNSQRT